MVLIASHASAQPAEATRTQLSLEVDFGVDGSDGDAAGAEAVLLSVWPDFVVSLDSAGLDSAGESDEGSELFGA